MCKWLVKFYKSLNSFKFEKKFENNFNRKFGNFIVIVVLCKMGEFKIREWFYRFWTLYTTRGIKGVETDHRQYLDLGVRRLRENKSPGRWNFIVSGRKPEGVLLFAIEVIYCPTLGNSSASSFRLLFFQWGKKMMSFSIPCNIYSIEYTHFIPGICSIHV